MRPECEPPPAAIVERDGAGQHEEPDGEHDVLDGGAIVPAAERASRTVHREEAFTAFLMMMNVFILLTAYYIIKPVREALILGGPGAVIKSYAGAGQAVLFWMLLPLYSAFAARVNRVRLINGVTAFFISNLIVFYLIGRLQFQFGVIFFMWVGLFNLMIVAQFWAFANDIYTQEQGRRLFAVVGAGSSLGAIVGSEIASWLFKPLGPYSMMLVAAGLLVTCMFLTTWIHRRERFTSPVWNRQRTTQPTPIDGKGAFQMIFTQRYLLLIAPMAIDGLTQLVGWRESNWELRTLTGALFGLASAAFYFYMPFEAYYTAKKRMMGAQGIMLETPIDRIQQQFGTMKDRELWGGVALVAIGGLYLLGNLDVFDLHRIARLWPALLVVAGVWLLKKHQEKGE